jgi:iron complex transport system substrate-binding protein
MTDQTRQREMNRLDENGNGNDNALSRRGFVKLAGMLGIGAAIGGTAASARALGASSSSSDNSEGAEADATGEEFTVTDSAGRTVTLSGNYEHIAALRGNSYERCCLFGRSDKVEFSMEPKAITKLVFPDFHADTLDDPTNPNIEELSTRGVDLTFFWNTPDIIESLEAAGIPVVVGTDEKNANLQSTSDFMEWMKSDINLFAQVFGGGEAETDKAQKWCDYADEVYKKVTERTSELSDDEIPSVYYVRGPEVTQTHAKKSITIWYVRMAGGRLVSEDIDEKIAEVDVEQINAWDPEYIFMGRLKSTDPITGSDDFKDITAVKNGNVFVNPCGIYEWDYGSEGVLFVQWLAKTLHPDLFEDIDVEKEVQWYYKTFYEHDLTDEELTAIMTNTDPE